MAGGLLAAVGAGCVSPHPLPRQRLRSLRLRQPKRHLRSRSGQGRRQANDASDPRVVWGAGAPALRQAPALVLEKARARGKSAPCTARPRCARIALATTGSAASMQGAERAVMVARPTLPRL